MSRYYRSLTPGEKADALVKFSFIVIRYDICADNLSNCGLMGLAYVASACDSKECCAINEDGGLVLGIVVAHEMGHVYVFTC